MAEGRDARGWFVKGAPPGPGRPKRRTERELIGQLREQLTPERFKAIVLRLIADAAQGDPDARKLLLGYVMGRPSSPAPTLTMLAIEEEAGIDPLAWDIEVRKDEAPDGPSEDGRNAR